MNYAMLIIDILIVLVVAVGCIRQLLREHKQKQGY